MRRGLESNAQDGVFKNFVKKSFLNENSLLTEIQLSIISETNPLSFFALIRRIGVPVRFWYTSMNGDRHFCRHRNGFVVDRVSREQLDDYDVHRCGQGIGDHRPDSLGSSNREKGVSR